MNISPKPVREKYVHYLELMEEFISEFIVNDPELIQLVSSSVGVNNYLDPAHRILVQDIMYQMLDMLADKDRKYWRIGTTSDTGSLWPEMNSENKVCIGWSAIGDLNQIENINPGKIKEKYLEQVDYQKHASTVSSKSNEIFKFHKEMDVGDIVLAQDGMSVLGIGLVSDGYSYNPKALFSHQREVDWLFENPPLQNKEGMRTTVARLESVDLIRQIENLLEGMEMEQVQSQKEFISSQPVNQILYGPPGTGKTFNSINKALEILGENLSRKNRKEIKELYQKYVDQGQIVFTTFHQSMSYEDFIEGIKPTIDPENEEEYKDPLFPYLFHR